MGDQLVLDICKLLAPMAFANGVSEEQLGPMVDVIVNRLRDHGHSDDDIIDMLGGE